MIIFNSLGSNYNFPFILKTILSGGSQNGKEELEQFLENKYKGKVTLLYKGREALELGLRSLNLPKESYVAINGFTCFAVYEAVKNAGLEVEYLDVEKGELNFPAEELQKHLRKNAKIRVVIIQNTLGYPCDIQSIAKVCIENNLRLIEDLAHSAGTRYENGEATGMAGDMAVLSFSQDKMVDGISGGALIGKQDTDMAFKNVRIRKQLLDRLYPLFTYIIRNTYPIRLGKILHKILKSLNLLSGPMDKLDNEIHQLPNWYCNLVNLSFSNLEENLDHRKKIANIYAANINPKILSSKITQYINLSSNLRFPIFVNNRAGLIKYLKQFNVYVSDIWYDAPIAPKKYLSLTDYQNQCPNARLAADEILNLPTHINISEKEATDLSQYINQWLKLQ